MLRIRVAILNKKTFSIATNNWLNSNQLNFNFLKLYFTLDEIYVTYVT